MEESRATHSSILAWRIAWTEEPGRRQSTGLQRVRHDWSDLAHMHVHLALCSPLLLEVILSSQKAVQSPYFSDGKPKACNLELLLGSAPANWVIFQAVSGRVADIRTKGELKGKMNFNSWHMPGSLLCIIHIYLSIDIYLYNQNLELGLARRDLDAEESQTVGSGRYHKSIQKWDQVQKG